MTDKERINDLYHKLEMLEYRVVELENANQLTWIDVEPINTENDEIRNL